MAYITLSRSAFFHNLDIISRQAEGKERIALVLKDNAYGHGLEIMASLAAEYGIRQAVVRTQDEAFRIESHFDAVLVLADIPEQCSEKCSYTVNALEDIQQFPRGCRVELKVDSGMHRNGIALPDLPGAFKAVVDAGLRLEGLFTHHRSADTLSSEWFWQARQFEAFKKEAAELAKQHGMEPLRFHSSNSAALFRTLPEDEAFARVGIAAYGCLQMDRTLEQPPLKPVMALWGERIATRTLAAGERVGYNGTYSADQNSVVSTYDVGYADGLQRVLSNNYVTPGGKALLGRVSMDNAVFEGSDEALLIFDNANSMASSAGTIGYEIMTGMRSHMKRIVVE